MSTGREGPERGKILRTESWDGTGQAFKSSGTLKVNFYLKNKTKKIKWFSLKCVITLAIMFLR